MITPSGSLLNTFMQAYTFIQTYIRRSTIRTILQKISLFWGENALGIILAVL
jgi:hypothetical protein